MFLVCENELDVEPVKLKSNISDPSMGLGSSQLIIVKCGMLDIKTVIIGF